MNKNLFNQYNVSSFELENSGRKIYHDLKGLGRQSRLTKRNIHEKCELIVFEGKVTLRVKGAEKYFLTPTTGNCRVEIYYTDLLEALENDRNLELVITIQARTMVINERRLSCSVKVIKDEKDLCQYGLGVLNFGEQRNDLPSWMQSEMWMLPSGKNIHMSDISRDIEKALTILKKYEVDREKLKTIMMEKMRKD